MRLDLILWQMDTICQNERQDRHHKTIQEEVCEEPDADRCYNEKGVRSKLEEDRLRGVIASRQRSLNAFEQTSAIGHTDDSVDAVIGPDWIWV